MPKLNVIFRGIEFPIGIVVKPIFVSHFKHLYQFTVVEDSHRNNVQRPCKFISKTRTILNTRQGFVIESYSCSFWKPIVTKPLYIPKKICFQTFSNITHLNTTFKRGVGTICQITKSASRWLMRTPLHINFPELWLFEPMLWKAEQLYVCMYLSNCVCVKDVTEFSTQNFMPTKRAMWLHALF